MKPTTNLFFPVPSVRRALRLTAALAALGGASACVPQSSSDDPDSPRYEAPWVALSLDDVSLSGEVFRPGDELRATATVRIDDANCRDCVVRAVAVLTGPGVETGFDCFGRGRPADGGFSGAFSFRLPETPGSYTLQIGAGLGSTCEAVLQAGQLLQETRIMVDDGSGGGGGAGGGGGGGGGGDGINHGPRIVQIPQTVPTYATGCDTRLSVVARDDDGDPLEVTWSGPGTADGRDFVLPGGGRRRESVSVQVSDGRGGSAARDLEIAVDPCILPSGAWVSPDGERAYILLDDLLTFDEARERAARMGGGLAVFPDAGETEAVWEAFGRPEAWVGLWSPSNDGSFQSVLVERMPAQSWCPGEPNNRGGNETAVQIWETGCLNDTARDGRLKALVQFRLPSAHNDVGAGGDSTLSAAAENRFRWRTLLLSAPRRVTLEVEEAGGGCTDSDPTLTLYFAGVAIYQNDDFDGTRCSRIEAELPPGVYEVKVMGFEGQAMGEMVLHTTIE
ncbi:MAG: C-type lectin domain-containing protein [bacterium]